MWAFILSVVVVIGLLLVYFFPFISESRKRDSDYWINRKNMQ